MEQEIKNVDPARMLNISTFVENSYRSNCAVIMQAMEMAR